MPRPNLIAVFRKFPKEIHRVNNGPSVTLRAWSPYRRSYNIVTKQHGLVEAKALNPSTYVAPNGASMGPNSVYQQSLVSWRFRGSDVIVYSVPKGTSLPDDLVLVHERTDHYSLQPAEQMTIDSNPTDTLSRPEHKNHGIHESQC
ncbi:hypothetical protein E4U13_000873 [Claviceps humidiphila]|uniref:Tse2 ADP-ribosyltransferase toxin domain-containing protein n=1 Tax=Claviceps humidiphila TaxID=1294629 RepID=A0A9P7TYJ7_9HYPO|nr:hypothetical protein E4U13_000873 [Claviceps humidiphila]